MKNNINGWLVIDKPEGITSAKAVYMVKKITGAAKAGHAGTLDPFASGILPIALGEATKTIQFCTDSEKTYRFTASFGETRDTDDREGKVINSGGRIPSEQEIKNVLPNFIGEISQVPPRFSAIKVNGERAYDMARDNEQFELKARVVKVNSLKLISGVMPNSFQHLPCNLDSRSRNKFGMTGSFEFEMNCGKGTYVRSIARDLAEKLGTYAYVSALRRSQVGRFFEKNAILLEDLQKSANNAALKSYVLPVEEVLVDIPVLDLNPGISEQLRHGQQVILKEIPSSLVNGSVTQGPINNGTVWTKSAGKLVAIGVLEENVLRPVRVFNLN